MKPQGAILEFTRERNNDLMRVYRHHIRKAQCIKIRDVALAIVNSPSSRFWVSEERATVVVSAILSGRGMPENIRPTKAEMFMEIAERVVQLQMLEPNKSISWHVSKVIYTPAPKFYMLPRSAMDIIYKIKNGYFEKTYADNPIYRGGAFARE